MGNYSYNVLGEYDHDGPVKFNGTLETVNGKAFGRLNGPMLHTGDGIRIATPDDKDNLVHNDSLTKGRVRVVEDIRMIELIKYAPRDLMSGEMHVYHVDKSDNHRTRGDYLGYMFILENAGACEKSARQIAHTLEEICSFMTPVGNVKMTLH